MAASNLAKADVARLSESMQMYLVTIARLRAKDRPVPLSQLAQELSNSPVSVNEMCRKLQDQGLVVYRPYKGALLTLEGERRALYVLRRHRLWEVFLVEKLGLEYARAHEAACQLEHTTPDYVTDRLDMYLGFPSVNPQGLPIPSSGGAMAARRVIPLAELPAGQRGQVVRCEASDASCAFLAEQGLRPGGSVTLLATGADSLLVEVGAAQLSLALSLASAIGVEPGEKADEPTEDSPLGEGSDKEKVRPGT